MSSDTRSALVSAIIPVYNGARYVGEAIRSVLDQTHPRLECVVVDDGSTDETPRIAQGFGESITYIRTENKGVSSARNLGVTRAKGTFVAFLDADDVWVPNKIARQLEAFAGSPGAGLVYTGLTITNEGLEPTGVMEAPPPQLAVQNSLLLEPPVISVAQTSLMPREIFRDVPGFDERLSTSADTDLACRVGIRYPLVAVDEQLVLYRQHPEQMHADPEVMRRDMVLVFDKLFRDPALPPELRRLRRRAYANLFTTVAAAEFKLGRYPRALGRLLRAIAHDPRRPAAFLRERVRR